MPKLSPRQRETIMSRRIQQAYTKVGNGVQINIMDTTKVFNEGKKLLTEKPEATDSELEGVLSAILQKIRTN